MAKYTTEQFKIITFARQSMARDILKTDSQAIEACMIRRQYGQIAVRVDDVGNNKVRLGGLQHCKNIWACPVCSLTISARRRALLAKLITFERKAGHSVAMITYTIAHSRDMSLADVIKQVKQAHKRFHSGKAWQSRAKRLKWRGSVVASEVTYSARNGWHFHLHELAVFAVAVHNITDRSKHFYNWRQRWQSTVASVGGSCSRNIGINIRLAYGDVNDYVGKWGLVPELVGKGLKEAKQGGMQPFQMLDLYLSGNDAERANMRALYREYYLGTVGLRQLQPSPQFKHYMVEEQTAENEPLEPLAMLDSELWYYIWTNNLRAELLNAGNSGFLHKWLGDTISKMEKTYKK